MGYSGARFWSIFRAKTLKCLYLTHFLMVLQGKIPIFSPAALQYRDFTLCSSPQARKIGILGSPKWDFTRENRLKFVKFWSILAKKGKKPPPPSSPILTQGGGFLNKFGTDSDYTGVLIINPSPLCKFPPDKNSEIFLNNKFPPRKFWEIL